MTNLNEKSFYEIETAILKALVPLETPIKVKHIWSTIIETFTQQGAKVLWSLATRQSVLDHEIVAWKFCHLLQKVLSGGHSLCCNDSMNSCECLMKMGKLWGLLEQGYGVCIGSYSKFLNTKICFHFRNPRFNANLQMTQDELEHLESYATKYFNLIVIYVSVFARCI